MPRIHYTHTDPQFRKELTEQLRSLVGKNKPWSVARAAKAVGVSEQAFYKYLDGTTTPKGEVVRKMVRLFDLRFRIDEYDFGKDAWLSPRDKPRASPEQIVIPFGRPIPVTEKVIMIVKKRHDESVVVELQLRR